AEEAAQLSAEQQAREAAEREESDRIIAVNQMMAHASAPTDPSHLASANAMLSEFSRTSSTTLATAEQDVDQARQLEPEPDPQPIAQRDLADTASLLRELSSLGFEDEPPPPSGPRPAQGAGPATPRPPTTSAPKKKRGLFGR
ncbi:MAG: hypothetical protein QOC73_1790, partial [Actinomycetota bacterium]|nr:hypothetical protein [Actinomycetota bacterium]